MRLISLRSGFTTLKEIIGEDGKDFAEHMAEIKESNDLIDKLDLTFDSDPRKVTKAGIVQVEEDDDPSKPVAKPATNGDARAH